MVLISVPQDRIEIDVCDILVDWVDATMSDYNGLHLVPSFGEEVLSMEIDGTETMLSQASAADAFAAAVKKMQLHKQHGRKSVETDQEGGKEDQKKKKKRSREDKGNEYRNPFEEVHKELAYACYELRQLTELTNLLCEKSLFKLENLQADERSKLSQFSDELLAFEMKKKALEDTLKILDTGKLMMESAYKTQRKYLGFIRHIQTRWRLQAIAHGNYSSNLRAQEPLAVDCGYYSAGSRGKAARSRQTRNAARLIVNCDGDSNTENNGISSGSSSDATELALDLDESTFRTIRFAIEKTSELGENRFLACSYVCHKPQATKEGDSDEQLVEQQLERLQQSEFCSELFQVLSVEAVLYGELSSGGATIDSSDIGNRRNKVDVIENVLQRVAVSLDAHHVLSISLVPASEQEQEKTFVVPDSATGVPHSTFIHEYCRVATIMAQDHLRNVHKGIFDHTLLGSLVDKFRQMETFQEVSSTLDQISNGLTLAANSHKSRLLNFRFSWVHRGPNSYCEISIGPQVLVRCKLASGHLTLGSICTVPGRQMPFEWQVAQQGVDHLFSHPDSIPKFRAFLFKIIMHEFLLRLYKMLLRVNGENLIIEMDASAGTLEWENIDGKSMLLAATIHPITAQIGVSLQHQDITKLTMDDLVREIMRQQ